MDILDPLPVALDESKYFLVLQDYFTKCPEVVALKSIDSNTVQDWLTDEIIPHYGVFSKLITDEGIQFVSNSFKTFCKSIGIKQKATSPFDNQTDGMFKKCI